MAFLKKVINTIEKYNMLEKKDTVVVGVSGGPDSIALLHVLNQIKEEYSLRLFVVHVNHMFRGEQAKKEADFVASFAKNFENEYKLFEKDVPALIKETSLSPQDAGHRIRKQIYSQVRQEIGATKLALGHHADDRAETILLHLVQGTGLEGLAGMTPVRGSTIRPLAEVSKKEILDYCQTNGLPYCQDPSNNKPVYLRNKVRLELLPLLKEKFNPQIIDNLIKLEEIVSAENDFMEEAGEEFLRRILVTRKEGKIRLSIKEFSKGASALRRRAIRKAYSLLRPDEQGLAFVHVENIIKLIQRQEGTKRLDLPRNILVLKSYEYIEFNDLERNGQETPSQFNLNWLVPGQVCLPFKGIALNAFFADTLPQTTGKFDKIALNPQQITSPLQVRNRKPGDKIQPWGMAGTKKVKDIFIDLKIPQQERDFIPLVVMGNEIIWIPGITLNEKYRMKTKEEGYLIMEMLKGEYV
ncbi:MAG: tRNA lysidine(34) synthetase TilS [Bacillota bacterium]